MGSSECYYPVVRLLYTYRVEQGLHDDLSVISCSQADRYSGIQPYLRRGSLPPRLGARKGPSKPVALRAERARGHAYRHTWPVPTCGQTQTTTQSEDTIVNQWGQQGYIRRQRSPRAATQSQTEASLAEPSCSHTGVA
jgi:hypothetical protein